MRRALIQAVITVMDRNLPTSDYLRSQYTHYVNAIYVCTYMYYHNICMHEFAYAKKYVRTLCMYVCMYVARVYAPYTNGS